MTQSQIMNLAISGGILFAAYKWGNSEVKTGAVALAALIVGKRLPYVQDQL